MKTVNRLRSIFVRQFLLTLPLVLFSVQNVCAQKTSALWGELPAGRYEVGFRTLDVKDFSRSFPQKSAERFAASAREIKINIWYPARNSSVTTTGRPKMKFSDYLAANVGAAAAMATAKNGGKFKKQIDLSKLSVAQELPPAAIENLLRIETAAVKNAPYIKGAKFPVIVFGQGLYYESPTTHTVLCEFLAAHGFIVAATKLAGADSPFVKLDAADLEAAVRDLEFVAAQARSLDIAVKERFGVVGFDLGGLAGLILAMRNPQIGAYASLDSGILAAHNLRLVKAMPSYDPLRLRAPLLQLTHPVEELARFNVTEDASFIDAARYSERLILRFPDTRHADFTSRPMIEAVAAQMRDERTTHRRRSFESIARNLLAFLQTHLRGDSKSREFLYDPATDASLSEIKFTKERKIAALRPAISEGEFFNYLYASGAEKGLILFRRLRAQTPNEPIFSEDAMNQIGNNRLYRGESAEAIRIFQLNVEAYPKSANAFDNLANAFAAAGDNERAKINYKRSLELDPSNENAKTRLKQLEEKK